MACRRDSRIRDVLTSVIAPRRVRALARLVGAVRRKRKVDIVALVYAVVLGFASGDRRTLAGLRRAYERVTGTCLVASAFYDRFTVGLTRLMKRLVHDALDDMARTPPRLRHAFAAFTKVLAVDGTVIRLHEALRAQFPSVWPHHMPASAKLHVVMNVVGRGPSTVRITHGSRQDSQLLRVGRWVRGSLLLFDLGYFSSLLFTQIGRHGGFFLTRMRTRGNPRIVACTRPEHRRWVGRSLQQILPRLQRETLDVDAEIRATPRWRRGDRRLLVTRVRVVGVWNDIEQRHHLYVTNVARDQLAPEQVAAVYAARWEVELLFREIKTHYRIDDVRSRRRQVTECLLYASILALLLSRRLHRLLAPRPTGFPQLHPFDRWAVLFNHIAGELLDLAVGPLAHRQVIALRLRRLLIHEAPDPNRNRLLLPARAQLGQIARAA
jgi:putative transposase